MSLTATVGGPDTLTVSGLNLTATQGLTVSDDSFAFVSPAAGTEIALGTNRAITVEWVQDGVAQANQNVQFSTTRGVLTPASAPTDANGRATVNVSSLSAGPAVVSAAAAGGPTTQLAVEFVATDPRKIVLQADPFTVAPNGQSTITAVVRDINNNLVKNERVVFTLTDITNGSLSPGSALTDSQGRAQTFYTASDTVSGSSGVVIQGLVESTASDPQPVIDDVLLTVARRELFVAIGTGNEIAEPNQANYQLEFSVLVTDSEGNGVPNATVQLNVKSIRYSKGYWVPGADNWVPQVEVTCDDEDVNGNGIIDDDELDEDINRTIEAGNVVLVTPGEPITDDTGTALVNLIYAQQYGGWTQVKFEAKVTVAGTESVEAIAFVLDVSADDVELDQAPPGTLTAPDPANGFNDVFRASPWGYRDSCAIDETPQ